MLSSIILPHVATHDKGLTALAYAEAGLKVLPLCWPKKDGSCGCPKGHTGTKEIGKAPLTPHGQRDASSDAEQVAQWWLRWPEANIGLSLDGAGIVVVDCDSPEAVAEAGRLGVPEGTPVVARGERRHYYFRAPDGMKPTRVSHRGESRGIDILGAGYVILPPSGHRDGDTYAWLVPPNGELPEAPPWVLELAKSRCSEVAEVQGSELGPPPSEGEIQAAAQAALPFLPARARAILQGAVPTSDRSGLAFELARLAAEAGLRDARTVALLVAATPAHRDKFERREDRWLDASRVAIRALRIQETGQRDPLAPPLFPEGVAKEFAEIYGKETEAPEVFWFWSFVTIIGAAISGQATLLSLVRPQPRLYTVLLAPSAVSRKSTALRLTADFLRPALEGRVAELWGLGSAEGLMKRLAPHQKPGIPVRTVILLDELKSFVAKAKIEGQVLLPALTTLFEANKFENHVKTGSISLADAHISLLGACTEQTYETMWDNQFLAIGLLNRLWIVPGRSEQSCPLPPYVDDDRLHFLRRRVEALLEELDHRSGFGQGPRARPPGPVELVLPEQALKLWESWYGNRPTDAHGVRLDSIGFRLMVLFEVLRGNLESVEADTVESVVAWLDWQHKARQAHDPLDCDTLQAKVEAAIRRALAARGPLTRRELARYAHAERVGTYFFQQALQALREAGEIAFDPKTKRFALATEGAVGARSA